MKLLRVMSTLLALSLGQVAIGATFDFTTVPGAVNDGSVGLDGWKIQGNSYSQTNGGITVTVSSLSNQLSYYSGASAAHGLGDSGKVFLVTSAGLQQGEKLNISFSEAVMLSTISLGGWDNPDKGSIVTAPDGTVLVLDEPGSGGMSTFDISSLGEVTSFTLQATSFTSLFTLSGLEVTPVPVPASAWLFATGILGLFGVGRNRARR